MGSVAACAQESVLFSFNSTDGAFPAGSLLRDANGNLFGTTETGGSMEGGTVFELSPAMGGGWTETVIHNFDAHAGSIDGVNPGGALILDSKGNLYGTTSSRGAYPAYGGTVFELSPASGDSWMETVIYSFGSSAEEGYRPTGTLVFDAQGNLYGTTESGGAYDSQGVFHSGTVFELTPAAGAPWTKKILHSFGAPGDGFLPLAGLALDSSMNLYGTTSGGGADANGTVYRLASERSGSFAYQIIHDFKVSQHGGDGAYPEAPVTVDGKGNLYGTTYTGGPQGTGFAFQLSPASGNAWTEKLLAEIAGSEAALTIDSLGNLYGTTATGGTYLGGTVYELTPLPDGSWAETVLHNFPEYDDGDGMQPEGGVIFDPQGNLYGTTNRGGIPNDDAGTVFEIAAATVAMRPIITTTTLAVDPAADLVAGEPITLTATVTPASGTLVPTGRVVFIDPAGGSFEMPLNGAGQAVYSGRTPAAGTYSLYASYSPDEGFAESRSATITKTVRASP